MRKTINEEQYETHYQQIAETVFPQWDIHKGSSCFEDKDILWSFVFAAAEKALIEGITQPYIEQTIHDAIDAAYQNYITIRGE